MHQPTIDYYNANADMYFQRTVHLNNAATLDILIPCMPLKARILDAGCGSGRDAKMLIERGFDVTALDASCALASLASAYIHRPVHAMAFSEMAFDGVFDGVLANASLLHLDRNAFIDALHRLWRSLKFGGAMVATFKSGATEIQDQTGRYFAYWSEEELIALFTHVGFSKVRVRLLPDLFGRDAGWYAVEAHKA
jgi:2-polyprenyl-3-methyl-5-hydroxy-6-metoxy-1,4-benzoquinol methylase